MPRFVYITDTHIGCDATGYHLQPRYLGRMAELFGALGGWLKDHGVDFIVHGGDLTDHGTAEEIGQARRLCAGLNVPVYLCLGNHDLAQRESIDHWTAGGELLPAGRDVFHHDLGGARLVIVPHHWHDDCDWRWCVDQAQRPRMDAERISQLSRYIGGDDRPVIAVTHAPLNAVHEHADAGGPFHPPHAPYLASWQSLAGSHANLRLVLAGHNHAHSRHDHGSFVSTTTAAFGEVPGQFRLITVTGRHIDIETHHMGGELSVGLPPIAAAQWCLGRADQYHERCTIRVSG